MILYEFGSLACVHRQLDYPWKKHKDWTYILDEGYVPIVKRTVCYIVMAFVFDDKGRILLIQEAKSSCRGQWYLPAGRVEPGENLIVRKSFIAAECIFHSICCFGPKLSKMNFIPQDDICSILYFRYFF